VTRTTLMTDCAYRTFIS